MAERDIHPPPTDIGLDEAQNLLDQGRLYYGQGEYKEALSCLQVKKTTNTSINNYGIRVMSVPWVMLHDWIPACAGMTSH